MVTLESNCCRNSVDATRRALEIRNQSTVTVTDDFMTDIDVNNGISVDYGGVVLERKDLVTFLWFLSILGRFVEVSEGGGWPGLDR